MSMAAKIGGRRACSKTEYRILKELKNLKAGPAKKMGSDLMVFTLVNELVSPFHVCRQAVENATTRESYHIFLKNK
jgi:hypothetical protein